MKTILFLVSFLVAVSVANAQQIQRFVGPQYPEELYRGSATNTLPVLSTNGFFTLPCYQGTNLALFVSYNWHAAPGAGDATAPVLELYRGIRDGAFETNRWTAWTLPETTTAMSAFTNFSTAGIPILRGRFLNHGTNAIATNVVVNFGFKN